MTWPADDAAGAPQPKPHSDWVESGERCGFRSLMCILGKAAFTSADMPTSAIAGATWLAAGVAYFGYLNKLRRDIVRLERARSYTYVRRFPLN
jgi:hypothetical protein